MFFLSRATRLVPLRLCLLAAAVASSLSARREITICGTHAGRTVEEFQLHLSAKRASSKRPRALSASAVRADAGNIALLDDSDGVVARRNPFDLAGKTLIFSPSPGGGYAVEVAGDTWDDSAAAAGTALSNLGDDDTASITLPFSFSFYGKNYSALFVNSDGNLSFGAGDGGLTDRSLGRFLGTTPRIAGLFTDLDPSRGTGTVRITKAADKFVASWAGVPDYEFGRPQTFQIRLRREGTIEIAWKAVTVDDAVVGVASGDTHGSPAVVDFSIASTAVYPSTVAERFAGSDSIDIFAAAQRFYQSHEDAYDYLVFYNNLGIEADAGAVAYETTVRNINRSGYGDTGVDVGIEAGSSKRLQALLNLGSLDQYPSDPDGPIALRRPSPDTPRTIIGHEAGHLFLAYASVEDTEGANHHPMLGYQGAHWSPLFNSEASLLEGERIQDNGPNASPRFTTTAAIEGYSPLDQYLMGFRALEEVPETLFYVTKPGPGAPSGLPKVNAGFNGTRRDVPLRELIIVIGPRIPDQTVAQRRFRFAFVLITASGKDPSAEEVAKLETFRQNFEEFYSRASSGRAVADTALRRSISVSGWPAVGMQSGSIPITIRTEKPVESDLTILLRTMTGTAGAPRSVTIPAGSQQATFPVATVRAGADTLTAEPADTRYETAELKISVTLPSEAKLTVVSGTLRPPRRGSRWLNRYACEFPMRTSCRIPPFISVQRRRMAGL